MPSSPFGRSDRYFSASGALQNMPVARLPCTSCLQGPVSDDDSMHHTCKFMHLVCHLAIIQRTSSDHPANIQRAPSEHPANIRNNFNIRYWSWNSSIEHLSNLQQLHLSNIYRTFIEHLSNIYRTSIEHLSNIYRPSSDLFFGIMNQHPLWYLMSEQLSTLSHR